MRFAFLFTLFCSFQLCQHVKAQIEFIHIGSQKIYYGASYYPEVWPDSCIDSDIARMKELHFNVVRMGEFAWSSFEPFSGKYNFQWMHHVIEKLHAQGIDVILGTPTATPPAWLAEKHPEIFLTNENGEKKTHGGRRNCSYSSEIYRSYCKKICESLAREFGQKPGVIGWQTDNEFGLSFDYSSETESRWHSWLQKQYGSIENLNSTWRTQLWSQQYDRFEQIPMPTSHVWHHPSLRFEWIRFTNEEIVSFQQIQVDALRKFSNLPITHDGMPGQKVNYEKLFQPLDFSVVNNYHSFEAYDRIISNYDRMRSMGKGMHWLFETAPNYSGGGEKGNTWFLHQPDGSMRAALWMNYALGAQGAMFWLWRQHPAGQEMVHGSVLSSWGKPAANYSDLKALGEELSRYSDYLMKNPVAPAKIAILYSHENAAGFEIEEYANGINYYTDWTYRFYMPMVNAYLHRDVIYPSAPVSSYKIIFAPLMPYMPEELRDKLKSWVKEGGILILGPMSGYRTKYWTSFTDHATGNFEDWMDITVDSRIPIGTKRREAELPVWINFPENESWGTAEASLWSEALTTENGKSIAIYNSGMHKGKTAIAEAEVGKGKVVYLGCDPGSTIIQKLLLGYAKEMKIFPMANGDNGVLVVPRANGMILVNIQNMVHQLVIDDRTISLNPYEILFLP